MSLFNKLFLGFCWCFCLTTAQGQYRFDSWTTENGLPQNSVYDILQTPDNYLWLATLDGLAQFDGVRFTIFNKSNAPGIVNNRFISLFEAEGGDLWAGTEESGVVGYHQGRFTSYGSEHGLNLHNTFWISGNADGNPIIFLSNLQVYRFWTESFQRSIRRGRSAVGIATGSAADVDKIKLTDAVSGVEPRSMVVVVCSECIRQPGGCFG